MRTLFATMVVDILPTALVARGLDPDGIPPLRRPLASRGDMGPMEVSSAQGYGNSHYAAFLSLWSPRPHRQAANGFD
ncbi:hypothetical protein QBC37DRAFT_386551 [Rhypophila decipiens]|uniref:Uncharacterized protein n=1 Tax=Rhypophila decipiens TaxID=261697 RepID=A0AAN6YAU8_9PEZI|nr:hypothetical protein QBC37DRAFT_386551 [Rhypophila decipiens]